MSGPARSGPCRFVFPPVLAGARRRFAAAGALVLVLLLAPAIPRLARASDPEGAGRALVSRLEGPVSPVMSEALSGLIRHAERRGYPVLVIELDTPGGLESSMRDMVKSMLASRVPILVWVSPSGARAASAGVFITLAADVAAMSPGSNIGAATPVNLQGPMDSTLARKVTNDASAFARTIARQRGRNVEWAERAVREAVSASETEAVDLHIVDFTAASLAELLAKADGRPWRRGDEAHVLRTRGLAIERIEPGFRQRLLALIADPSVAYILMMLGFYGLMFELQNPGAVLPGVVGGICLILAFFALSTLPVNYAGVALILLAIVFFVAEIKVASHGLLAAGGILAMLLGSMILYRGEGTRVSWGIIAGATLSTALFFAFIVGAGLRAQRRRVETGVEGLVGERGVAVGRLAPGGQVRVRGELWSAVAGAEVDAGETVEILGVERLTLRVRPVAKEARS